ncbi:MAG: proline--tRNA ligase [Rhodobiaceae bacterium]|nr:proline--tRNA ligase [Rhodobiaceae bacterium]|tara:strand:- start:17099 stop:18400 length:1302 start_codon:yes stop_codon:yes gene_type:complete
MKLSKYFLPTLKEVPKDAEIISHRLMLRAGMIRQASSGIYIWLPLGYAVLKRIEKIIREEQINAGAIELLMPTIQSADIWKKSGRYDDYGSEMLRMKDRHDRDILYGPTNEEQITDIASHYFKSYKELPKILFHIQWKFRDEVRPRFGVMRCKEFLMKDSYSFDVSEQDGRESYNKMFLSYLKTFKRMGLTAIPMQAESGPIGGNLSHEFIILADTGESKVYIDKRLLELKLPENINYASDSKDVVHSWTKFHAVTEDMFDQKAYEANVDEENRLSTRGIEVGHVFYFGDKYTKPLSANVQDRDGTMNPIQSGSYGIGVSRLVAAIIEASHDEKGIIWPESVSPFDIALINLNPKNEELVKTCDKLYAKLQSSQSVLYDDTPNSVGEKLSRMDLIGIPEQIILGNKSIQNKTLEIKNRKTGDVVVEDIDNFLK